MKSLQIILKQGHCNSIACTDCYFYIGKNNNAKSHCKIRNMVDDFTNDYYPRMIKETKTILRENKLKRLLK